MTESSKSPQSMLGISVKVQSQGKQSLNSNLNARKHETIPELVAEEANDERETANIYDHNDESADNLVPPPDASKGQILTSSEDAHNPSINKSSADLLEDDEESSDQFNGLKHERNKTFTLTET